MSHSARRTITTRKCSPKSTRCHPEDVLDTENVLRNVRNHPRRTFCSAEMCSRMFKCLRSNVFRVRNLLYVNSVVSEFFTAADTPDLPSTQEFTAAGNTNTTLLLEPTLPGVSMGPEICAREHFRHFPGSKSTRLVAVHQDDFLCPEMITKSPNVLWR